MMGLGSATFVKREISIIYTKKNQPVLIGDEATLPLRPVESVTTDHYIKTSLIINHPVAITIPFPVSPGLAGFFLRSVGAGGNMTALAPSPAAWSALC